MRLPKHLRISAALVVLLLLVVWLALDGKEEVSDSPTASLEFSEETESPGAVRQTSQRTPSETPPGVASGLEAQTPIPTGIPAESEKRRLISTDSGDDRSVIVYGTVLDADDRSPVPGALLDALSTGGLIRKTPTDADGAFRFSFPRGTTFSLTTQADGYLLQSRSEVYVESNTRLVVQLEKELVLRGLVVDQAGSPVEGARISFWYPNGIASIRKRLTGPDGTFEISYGSRFGGPETRPEDCEVRVFHPAATGPATADVNLRTDRFVTLTLDLSEDETSLIRGAVSDLDGNVARGVTVGLFRGPGPPVMSTTTDLEGQYQLESIRPGQYSLAAFYMSPAMAEAPLPVTVEASQEYRIDLVVDLGQSVEGRVTSTTGVPLRGTWMRCQTNDVHSGGGGTSTFGQYWSTNEEGRFIFNGLKRRFTYTISATHPDYQQFEIELSAPWPEFLEIVLEEGLTLAGVVNDSRGMPVSGGTVSVALPGQSDDLRSVSLEGSSGAFRMAGLPDGTLELRVALPAGLPLTAPIELDSDRRILVLCGDDLRILPY